MDQSRVLPHRRSEIRALEMGGRFSSISRGRGASACLSKRPLGGRTGQREAHAYLLRSAIESLQIQHNRKNGLQVLIFLDGTKCLWNLLRRSSLLDISFIYFSFYFLQKIPGAWADWDYSGLPLSQNFPSYHILWFGILYLVL